MKQIDWEDWVNQQKRSKEATKVVKPANRGVTPEDTNVSVGPVAITKVEVDNTLLMEVHRQHKEVLLRLASVFGQLDGMSVTIHKMNEFLRQVPGYIEFMEPDAEVAEYDSKADLTKKGRIEDAI